MEAEIQDRSVLFIRGTKKLLVVTRSARLTTGPLGMGIDNIGGVSPENALVVRRLVCSIREQDQTVRPVGDLDLSEIERKILRRLGISLASGEYRKELERIGNGQWHISGIWFPEVNPGEVVEFFSSYAQPVLFS